MGIISAILTLIDFLSGLISGYAGLFTLSGTATFNMSGTASNSGGTYSSVLSLNLSIPENAVVDSISLSGSMSPSVGGVRHLLNSGGAGWIAGTGKQQNNLSGYFIEVLNLEIWYLEIYNMACSTT